MSTQSNPVPTFSNGVYLRTVKYDTVTHLDTAGLLHLQYGGKAPITDLGTVQLFANRGYLTPDVDTLSFRTQRISVDTHDFRYGVPIGGEDWAVEDVITEGSELGQSGEKFKVVMRGRKYDNNWVVGVDQSYPLHLLITKDEIIPYGPDTFIYTMQVVGSMSNDKGFPRQLLTKGTPLFGFYTVDHEYNRTYSSLPTMQTGKREFVSQVGMGASQLHFTVTREAAHAKVSKETMIPYDEFLETLEIYKFQVGSLGYDFQNLTPEQRRSQYRTDNLAMAYKSVYGTEKAAMSAMEKDTVLNLWVPRMEAIMRARLQMITEAKAFYGTGGTVEGDGATQARIPLGLIHQFLNGHRHVYTPATFNLGLFEAALTARLQGNTTYSPFGTPPKIKMKSGRGGISLIQKALANQPAQNGMMWNADPYVMNMGDARNLYFNTPKFATWCMANNMAIIEVEYDPALDPALANEKINPFVNLQNGLGGNRLSSYIFYVDDLKMDAVYGENIKEIVYGPDNDVSGFYRNGRLAYPGSSTMNGLHHGDPSNPGFSVQLIQRDKAYHIFDTNRTLVFLPTHPSSGKPMYSHLGF